MHCGRFLFISLLVLAGIGLLAGCKDLPPEPEPITEDLFPLVVGNQIIYSGFLRDPVTDANIISTGPVYETRWTIVSNAAPLPPVGGISGVAHLIVDSTVADTSGFDSSAVYLGRPAATGVLGLAMIINVGYFYRTFDIQQLGGGIRSDSLQWIDLFKIDGGVGVDFTALDKTWTSQTFGNATLRLIGQFEDRENITLNGETFSTYRLLLRRTILVTGSPAESDAPMAEIWFAPGIGPVKMILHADGSGQPGHYREYKSRNF